MLNNDNGSSTSMAAFCITTEVWKTHLRFAKLAFVFSRYAPGSKKGDKEIIVGIGINEGTLKE